ncbi:hypothetical protein [Actinoplanes sp. URMC 104]
MSTSRREPIGVRELSTTSPGVRRTQTPTSSERLVSCVTVA